METRTRLEWMFHSQLEAGRPPVDRDALFKKQHNIHLQNSSPVVIDVLRFTSVNNVMRISHSNVTRKRMEVEMFEKEKLKKSRRNRNLDISDVITANQSNNGKSERKTRAP